MKANLLSDSHSEKVSQNVTMENILERKHGSLHRGHIEQCMCIAWRLVLLKYSDTSCYCTWQLWSSFTCQSILVVVRCWISHQRWQTFSRFFRTAIRTDSRVLSANSQFTAVSCRRLYNTVINSVRIVKKITGGLANMEWGAAGAERVGFREGMGLWRGEFFNFLAQNSAFWRLFWQE